jgi:hypothetical protein
MIELALVCLLAWLPCWMRLRGDDSHQGICVV